MADPDLGKAKMMGYFMDQGFSDLVLNVLFGTAGTKNRGTKKGNTIRKTYSLEITLFRPGNSLIKTEKEIPFSKTQFL